MKVIMEHLTGLWLLMIHPSKFFKTVVKEDDIAGPLRFFVLLDALFLALIGLVSGVYSALAGAGPLTLVSQFIFTILLGLVISVISVFISAILVHIGVYIFGGRQGFGKTFKPYTYSSIIGMPYVLVGVVILFLGLAAVGPDPTTALAGGVMTILGSVGGMLILAFAGTIHSLAVAVIGVSRFQKISGFRAFLGIILIPLILVILGTLLALSIFLIAATTVSSGAFDPGMVGNIVSMVG